MKFGLSIFEKLLLHEFYPCSDASRVVVSVGFVEAKTYELTVYIHFAVGHLIAFWLVSSHESATAILEGIVDLTKSTTESITITVGITATEETYLFAIEVLFLQSIEEVVPVIADLYEADFPEVKENREQIIAVLLKEEKAFRQTLRKGLRQMQHYIDDGLTGEELFTLYDTFGFPVELSTEEAYKQGIKLSDNWRAEFDAKMEEQQQKSDHLMWK